MRLRSKRESRNFYLTVIDQPFYFVFFLIGIGIAQMMAGIYQAGYFPTLATVIHGPYENFLFYCAEIIFVFVSGPFSLALLDLAAGVGANYLPVKISPLVCVRILEVAIVLPTG